MCWRSWTRRIGGWSGCRKPLVVVWLARDRNEMMQWQRPGTCKRLYVDTEASRSCARELAGNPYLAGEAPRRNRDEAGRRGSARVEQGPTSEHYFENLNNDPLPR